MKLSEVFLNFEEAAQFGTEFFIQRSDSFCKLADTLQDTGLPLKDHYTFAMSPLDDRNDNLKKYLHQFANDFSR
jgi:hypothetical protein